MEMREVFSVNLPKYSRFQVVYMPKRIFWFRWFLIREMNVLALYAWRLQLAFVWNR